MSGRKKSSALVVGFALNATVDLPVASIFAAAAMRSSQVSGSPSTPAALSMSGS